MEEPRPELPLRVAHPYAPVAYQAQREALASALARTSHHLPADFLEWMSFARVIAPARAWARVQADLAHVLEAVRLCTHRLARAGTLRDELRIVDPTRLLEGLEERRFTSHVRFDLVPSPHGCALTEIEFMPSMIYAFDEFDDWAARYFPANPRLGAGRMRDVVRTALERLGARRVVALWRGPDQGTDTSHEVLVARCREWGLDARLVAFEEASLATLTDADVAFFFHFTPHLEQRLPALRSLTTRPTAVGAIGLQLVTCKALFCVLTDAVAAGTLPPAVQAAVRALIPSTAFADRVPRARLLERQAELVLKPNNEYGGRGVVIGATVTADAWRDAVDRAQADQTRAWVVQVRIEMRYLDAPTLAGTPTRHAVGFEPMAFVDEDQVGWGNISARMTTFDHLNANRGALGAFGDLEPDEPAG